MQSNSKTTRAVNKYLLISGGTKGLGRAISIRYNQEGYHVTALYKTDQISAKSIECEHINCVKHDITLSQFIHSKIKSDDELVIIHNAAENFTPKPFHLIGIEEYKKQWEAAVVGAHNLIYPSLKMMVGIRKATVIATLTSAIIEELPPKGFSPYASAKNALKSLIQSLANEYSDRGLRFICVSPGFMDTEFTRSWDSRLKQAILEGTTTLSTELLADEIYKLSHSLDIPAIGENYKIPRHINE